MEFRTFLAHSEIKMCPRRVDSETVRFVHGHDYKYYSVRSFSPNSYDMPYVYKTITVARISVGRLTEISILKNAS